MASREIQSASDGSTPERSSSTSVQANRRGASASVIAVGVGSKRASWVNWP
jgi:hypothetical protein